MKASRLHLTAWLAATAVTLLVVPTANARSTDPWPNTGWASPTQLSNISEDLGDGRSVFSTGTLNGASIDAVADAWARSHGKATIRTALADGGVKYPTGAPGEDPALASTFWTTASTIFAEQAKGTATVMVGDAFPAGGSWESIECPSLIKVATVPMIAATQAADNGATQKNVLTGSTDSEKLQSCDPRKYFG